MEQSMDPQAAIMVVTGFAGLGIGFSLGYAVRAAMSRHRRRRARRWA